MDLSLRFIAVEEMESLKAYVKEKLDHAFPKLGKVKSCEVIFRDQNGPKGGVDNTCHLTIKHIRTGLINATSTRENYFEAFADCLKKAFSQITRARKKLAIQRHRSLRVRAAGLISSL